MNRYFFAAVLLISWPLQAVELDEILARITEAHGGAVGEGYFEPAYVSQER